MVKSIYAYISERLNNEKQYGVTNCLSPSETINKINDENRLIEKQNPIISSDRMLMKNKVAYITSKIFRQGNEFETHTLS